MASDILLQLIIGLNANSNSISMRGWILHLFIPSPSTPFLPKKPREVVISGWSPELLQDSDSMGDDRISELPEGILHQILTLLPLDQMVRTCVLSTRWKRVWCSAPVLRFTYREGIKNEDYINIVDHCLRLCADTEKLVTLRFEFCESPDLPAVADRWVRFAAGRTVDELLLIYCHVDSLDLVDAPASLFDCRSLSTLKIDGGAISAVPDGSGGCFPRLGAIYLHEVDVSEQVLCDLIAACPRIEHVSLSGCRGLGRVAIRAPTVKEVAIHWCGARIGYREGSLERLEFVGARALKRLVFFGDAARIVGLECFRKLEEAVIISSPMEPFVDRMVWRKFIEAIASVKVLTVNAWFFQFLLSDDPNSGIHRPVFMNLKELHWWCHRLTQAELRALFSTLRDCSFLEKLCIHVDFYNCTDEDSSDDNMEVDDQARNDPLQAIWLALPRLNELVITEFSNQVEEMQLMTIIIDAAPDLTRIFVYYVPELYNEIDEIYKKLPSPMRNLVAFLGLPEEDVCPKHEVMWEQLMKF